MRRPFDHTQAVFQVVAHADASQSWSGVMHPIVSELFTKPVGWMTLGGLGFIVLMGGYLWWFARKKISEETSAE
jgi:hypothetical protein